MNGLCLHENTSLRWQPRGVDVVCRDCPEHTFVPRTKLLAYGRSLLTQQLNAKEMLHSVFVQAIDSGNDVQVSTFTDDAKPVGFRGVVQRVDEEYVEMTVDFRASVRLIRIKYADMLNAVEIIPQEVAEPIQIEEGEDDGGSDDEPGVSNDELGEVQASGI